MKKYYLIFFLLFSPLYSNPDKAEQLLGWEHYFESGIAEFQKTNYIEALSLFEKAELESNELERVYYNQGLCHLYMEEYELAEEKLTKAISSIDRELEVMARYNLGHLYYQQTIMNSSDSGLLSKDDPQLNMAITEFRNNKQLAENKNISLSNKALAIIEKSKENEKIILAKLKYSEDIKLKARGKKIPFFQGTANMNGRPANNAYVYVKSKWDESIIGTARTDKDGQFKIEGLDIGKYQLAASLYHTEEADHIKFSDNILKIPTYENDQHNQEIRGALSLGSPYQSAQLPLAIPYNDSSRASGPDSIMSSTDWGELTDGRPSHTFPEDHDLDQGYVAFDSQHIQIAMGLPQQQGHPAASQEIKNSTEPQEPPTFIVTLKGFHDEIEAVLPEQFSVYGLKPPENEEAAPPQPELLYQTKVQTTDPGSYEWQSEEFEQKGFRQLLFSFNRINGKRISLHEIEVNENTKQQNQQNQNQNQDQNQDQNQQDGQQNQQDEQQNQEQQPQENRDLRKILQKVREKSDEAKKAKEGQKFFLRTDKDY